MKQTLTYILVGIGTGLIGGGIGALLTRRHYEGRIDEAVRTEDLFFDEKLKDKNAIIDLATREIFELRKAVASFCDVATSSTILSHVRHIMEGDEYEERYRAPLEYLISEHSEEAKTTKKVSEEAKVIAESLGYSQKPDLEELWAIRMKAVREAAEENMAESEYPGEEVGAEKLAPNGDILDDAYDDEVEQDDIETDPDRHAVPGDDWSKKWDKPYIIPEWEFINGYPHYTSCSIEYYAGDDTLVDEDESIMDQNFVGVDNLKAFEETEEPSIFVRDDQYEVDYEILWHEEAFDGVDPVEVTGKRIWRPWEKEEN